MSHTATLPPLICYGAGDKFSHWRELQERAILAAVDSPKRFVFQAAPTGFGKSPVYMGQALITGARTVILTSTKGLQTQLIDDFADVGLVDIRGMNSYECLAASEFGLYSARTITCEEGPCRAGLSCSKRDGGCSYYDAYRTAKDAQLVVTNYSYWMTMGRYATEDKDGKTGLGEFDLMIMDEGHNAPDELSGFLATELEPMEMENVLHSHPLAAGATLDDWKRWATKHRADIGRQLDTLVGQIKETRLTGGKVEHSLYRQAQLLRRVEGKLRTVVGAQGEWVVDVRNRYVHFDPVWPAPYAEQVLFRGVPKVVVFSATIRPKTADILGVPAAQRDFFEYPSSFPVSTRPVIHVPTVQLNHTTSKSSAHVTKWLARIDQIIAGRLDRKGIVHTVSFERRNQVMQHSEYRDIMYTNDSRNTRAVVEAFKSAPPPAVLVSPSLTTGWDFPYDASRYQIVGKIPFIDSRSEIMQARCKSDKAYSNYLTMQILIQMCGRSSRAEDDFCETFIIDDNIKWFLWHNKFLAPKWFLDSYKEVYTIPVAPEIF